MTLQKSVDLLVDRGRGVGEDLDGGEGRGKGKRTPEGIGPPEGAKVCDETGERGKDVLGVDSEMEDVLGVEGFAVGCVKVGAGRWPDWSGHPNHIQLNRFALRLKWIRLRKVATRSAGLGAWTPSSSFRTSKMERRDGGLCLKKSRTVLVVFTRWFVKRRCGTLQKPWSSVSTRETGGSGVRKREDVRRRRVWTSAEKKSLAPTNSKLSKAGRRPTSSTSAFSVVTHRARHLPHNKQPPTPLPQIPT